MCVPALMNIIHVREALPFYVQALAGESKRAYNGKLMRLRPSHNQLFNYTVRVVLALRVNTIFYCLLSKTITSQCIVPPFLC